MQETEAVEVAKEDQGKNRCHQKELGEWVCACDGWRGGGGIYKTVWILVTTISWETFKFKNFVR